MMLIGKTANWLLRHSIQCCVKSRRLVCAHARSVKVALKCLIAVVLVDVDLSYWTLKVEHLVALRPLSATFALRMRRNGYLCTSGVNLDTAVRFADPDFLLECKISAIRHCFMLIFAFNILIVRHISTSGLFDLLT